MILGMSAFGFHLGVAFAFSIDNLTFMGIGLPVGMVKGLAVCPSMDKKAEEKVQQLNRKIK